MTNKDALVDCPHCGQKSACYKTPLNEFHFSYLCLGCGFYTNDLMRAGEFDIESFEESLPELYKDIKKQDEEGRVWYPNVVNIEGKGTAFINGPSADDWEWSAIKSVPLTEEERALPKFKGKEFKSDSKSLKDFGKDFLSALEYIEVEL